MEGMNLEAAGGRDLGTEEEGDPEMPRLELGVLSAWALFPTPAIQFSAQP